MFKFQTHICAEKIGTVNSEISRGFYFREASHSNAKVREKIKLSRYGNITLSFADLGVNHAMVAILTSQVCFNGYSRK